VSLLDSEADQSRIKLLRKRRFLLCRQSKDALAFSTNRARQLDEGGCST
jgi:hypothetical protein